MCSVFVKIGELYNYVKVFFCLCILLNSLGSRDKCYDFEVI